ncbi:hypothetical protein MCOR22_001589, partial [Pyricularia oryzae]
SKIRAVAEEHERLSMTNNYQKMDASAVNQVDRAQLGIEPGTSSRRSRCLHTNPWLEK